MKIIAHILLFYFTIGACLPKCDFSQLTRMADLMEHYDLHELEAELKGETCSIFDFIYLHFIAGDEHQHDDSSNEHQNLPLKTIASTTLFINQETIISSIKLPLVSCLNFSIPTCSIQEFVSSFFHPPAILG